LHEAQELLFHRLHKLGFNFLHWAVHELTQPVLAAKVNGLSLWPGVRDKSGVRISVSRKPWRHAMNRHTTTWSTSHHITHITSHHTTPHYIIPRHTTHMHAKQHSTVSAHHFHRTTTPPHHTTQMPPCTNHRRDRYSIVCQLRVVLCCGSCTQRTRHHTQLPAACMVRTTHVFTRGSPTLCTRAGCRTRLARWDDVDAMSRVASFEFGFGKPRPHFFISF
jgi:hypothetical protein